MKKPTLNSYFPFKSYGIPARRNKFVGMTDFTYEGNKLHY